MNVDEARALIAQVEDRDLAKELDSDLVLEAVQTLATEYLATRTDVSMKGVRGAPDWLGYEQSLWDLSERVRGFIRIRQDIRGDTPFLRGLATIAGDSRFGKGRQNLVLMLGEYGRDTFSDLLGQLLDDDAVFGHAVKALTKAKIGGFVDKISAIGSATSVGWIRQAARRYRESLSGD